MNDEVLLTLDDAVAEVLGLLTGLDLEYDPELDRYRSITRQLNRALRANALENEWSYYAELRNIGNVTAGAQMYRLPASVRPRINDDDSVRLVDEDGLPARWAYYLPRDALHKYSDRPGLWCSITYRTLEFSRPLYESEEEFSIVVPVMREPIMFRLPEVGETVPDAIRQQEVDFFYPDLIVAKAAFYYAQADPVFQPRSQTLEQGYKDLMYQLIERDTKHTDSPYVNEFILPIESGLVPSTPEHRHPHAEWS
jgi:hypothetical protein